MWEDFEAGRKTEVEIINGEVVALARSLGRQAPVNQRFVELVHAVEQGSGRRNWTARELHAEIHGHER
jgi:2-dehydropantoate 2-reductase